MSRILDVYLHEFLAGQLIQNDHGRVIFKYDQVYLADPARPSISISLPKTQEYHHEKNVKAFFSGLLPEDLARYRIARYFGVSEKNPFALLAAIGGECAGALALYQFGEKPHSPSTRDIEILDDKKLLEIIGLLKTRPLLAGVDNIRLSLAGAQDKLAVGLVDNKVALIHGNTPTTHILKPIIEGIEDSVYNEYFCMNLAQKLKIKIPNTTIGWLGDTPFFLIERYDRVRNAENEVKRVHQEDFCQALSIPPELKYENEGGPSMAHCLAILNQYSQSPIADRQEFLRRVIFNYLIGNADAHGKNYSLLYTTHAPILAPAYDILCTEIYPNVSMKMAMKIGDKYDPDAIYARHWYKLVPDATRARDEFNKQLLNMATECLDHAQSLKTQLIKQSVNATVLEKICKVIKRRADLVISQSCNF